MPFNAAMLVTVATASAEVWQRVSRLPEFITGDQLLDLVICFPARQLGRIAACVCDLLCFSPSPNYGHPYNYSSSDDDGADDGYEYYDGDGGQSSSFSSD